jgi:hypothetical protein
VLRVLEFGSGPAAEGGLRVYAGTGKTSRVVRCRPISIARGGPDTAL